MDLTERDKSKTETGEEIAAALIAMIEQYLDLKRWNFQISYTNQLKTSSIRIIYDSEWCRVKFSFSRQWIPSHDELTIDYGRLHAPNEQPFMQWQGGDQCRCWHNIVPTLYFLDGLTAYDAVQRSKIQKRSPVIIENFDQSEIGIRLYHEYPPKAHIALHSILWQHYGKRLFKLFDLGNADLWESYRTFVTEYYKLKGMNAIYGPPYGNIC